MWKDYPVDAIREMDKVAIGRVVLTNREHIIALEPLEKGLVGTLLRYRTRSAPSRSISTRSVINGGCRALPFTP
jgi:non-homologous end joining protein Ku